MSNRALMAQLQKIAGDYPEAITAGLEILLSAAQENAPVRTGELRDSGRINEAERAVEFTAQHAAPVEFGTSRMAARPFLRKAADEKAADIVQAIGKAVQEEMRGRL